MKQFTLRHRYPLLRTYIHDLSLSELYKIVDKYMFISNLDMLIPWYELKEEMIERRNGSL